ncbi:MAG: hypothetical protein HS113_07995 [Verrucomicrobiales bacterium]|nr:hypothetical protein [Verrucomicrobiales bacterium]
MKTALLGFVLVVMVGSTGCNRGTAPAPAAPTNAPATSAQPLTAPVDYVGAVGRAGQHSAQVVDLAQVKQAIQQFHAGEDRYPQNLEELVREGYLAKLPKLPAGREYRYDPATGQVR